MDLFGLLFILAIFATGGFALGRKVGDYGWYKGYRAGFVDGSTHGRETVHWRIDRMFRQGAEQMIPSQAEPLTTGKHRKDI